MKAASPAPAPRQAWVDNARTAVVCLVVNMHCCVTYSHVGGWYAFDGPEGSLAEKFPYILWIFHLQAFFMGLMFFLAGAFAEGAIQRHGAAAFLRERCFRLGLPALVYMAVVQPFIVDGLLAEHSGSDERFGAASYVDYLFSARFLGSSGPMWFALALLFFSAILSAWRLAKRRAASGWGAPPSPVASLATQQKGEHLGGGLSFPQHRPAPSFGALFVVAAGLTVATALTRGFFPIGASVYNFQICYFPQYIAAFAFGIAAARGGWLTDMAASNRARNAGLLALVGGPLLLTLLVCLGGAPEESGAPGEHGPILYFGGWSAQAFGAAAWEQFTGLGLALGLMAWCQRRFNQAGSISLWLAARSFGVYFIHPPILVGLTLAFRTLTISPLAHITLLTVAGLGLSFGAADLMKRVPGLRDLLWP